MEAHGLLTGWESFYVIVGSSAAALTGLQFVVIALAAELRPRSSSDQIDAFATPSIVHFCVALLTSATLSAPWRGLGSPAIAIGLTGLAGVLYEAIVIRRTRRQTGYQPVFEDWLWHACLPLIAYASLVGAAVAIPSYAESALFVVAAASLLLVFIGIHNAWDTVIFITVTRVARPSGATPPESGEVPVDKTMP
jgi:hypothetical protein